MIIKLHLPFYTGTSFPLVGLATLPDNWAILLYQLYHIVINTHKSQYHSTADMTVMFLYVFYYLL